VARFGPRERDAGDPSERMRRPIDSPQGRRLYSQRIATVEPVFANIRHRAVSTRWQLYCLVHNIEKLAKHR